MIDNVHSAKFNFYSKRSKKGKGPRSTTYVEITVITADGPMFLDGLVKRWSNDQDHKALAQKYAVAKALGNNAITKEAKQDIWSAFASHSKKTAKIMGVTA